MHLKIPVNTSAQTHLDNCSHLYTPVHTCVPSVILNPSPRRVCFPVQINQLPRESQLTVTLHASSLPPPAGSEEKSRPRRSIEALGWVTMPLFNFRQ